MVSLLAFSLRELQKMCRYREGVGESFSVRVCIAVRRVLFSGGHCAVIHV
jgi:hypothetical protein